MTGRQHRLFWMRSAWWCEDCRQKIEGCCEGGGCPSVADVMERAEERPATDRPGAGRRAPRPLDGFATSRKSDPLRVPGARG